MKKILFSSLPETVKTAAEACQDRESLKELANKLAENMRENGFSILTTRGGGKISLQDIETGRFHVLYDQTVSRDTVTFMGRMFPLPSGDTQQVENKLISLLNNLSV